MFKNDFIVAVRRNGQILREVGDLVSLPFGSEYSLLLKNKSSRKAVVSVEIDGSDVLNGNRLVIYPNSETDLMGFMSGNAVKNRFKFIQKTKEIVEHRGDKVDDSFIRVEFQYEKAVREVIRETIVHRHYYPSWYYPYPQYPRIYCSGGTLNADNVFSSGSTTYASSNCSSTLTGGSAGLSTPEIKPDEGITVKGSEVNQAFNYIPTNELESNSEVIVLRLKGTTNGDEVKEAVMVRGKVQCETCGRKSKSGAKFCENCGTALI